jgi:hypothetical protein
MTSMDPSPLVTGVLIGIVVGFPGGMLYSAFRRSWTDVAGAKKAIPGARKIAMNRTREFLVLGVILAVALAVAIGLAKR